MGAEHDLYAVVTLEDRRQDPILILSQRVHILSHNYDTCKQIYDAITYQDFNTRYWKPYTKCIVKTALDKRIEEDLCNEQIILKENIPDDPKYI